VGGKRKPSQEKDVILAKGNMTMHKIIRKRKEERSRLEKGSPVRNRKKKKRKKKKDFA